MVKCQLNIVELVSPPYRNEAFATNFADISFLGSFFVESDLFPVLGFLVVQVRGFAHGLAAKLANHLFGLKLTLQARLLLVSLQAVRFFTGLVNNSTYFAFYSTTKLNRQQTKNSLRGH